MTDRSKKRPEVHN